MVAPNKRPQAACALSRELTRRPAPEPLLKMQVLLLVGQAALLHMLALHPTGPPGSLLYMPHALPNLQASKPVRWSVLGVHDAQEGANKISDQMVSVHAFPLELGQCTTRHWGHS